MDIAPEGSRPRSAMATTYRHPSERSGVVVGVNTASDRVDAGSPVRQAVHEWEGQTTRLTLEHASSGYEPSSAGGRLREDRTQMDVRERGCRVTD